MITLKVKGLDVGIKDLVDKMNTGWRTHIDLGEMANAGARAGVEWLIGDMHAPKSGRKHPHLSYQSSASGQTPAVQNYHSNGRGDDVYMDGLHPQRGEKTITVNTPARGVAEIQATASHSSFLEFGTWKMDARRPIQQTVERGKDQVEEAIHREARRQFRVLHDS
jgi:hypothetical protein